MLLSVTHGMDKPLICELCVASCVCFAVHRGFGMEKGILSALEAELNKVVG